MLNIITAQFCNNKKSAWTDEQWQWDYGQILQFEGLELPEAYEVHFSNIAIGGESITQIGGENGVTIPDQFFTTGETIYAWVYLHQGEDDGETEYSVTIPVKKRPQPSDTPPTPQEQSAIDQAIAALNVAVVKAEDAIEHYPHIQSGTWWVWDVTTETWVDTQVEAQGPKGNKGDDGYSPTVTVTDITDGHRVTITDKTGAHVFDIMDGEKGDAGVSPSVTVTDITGGHRVKITDEVGDHTFDVMNGTKGDTGNGIASIAKTGTVGLVDTYTITYTNGQTTTFTVTNGSDATVTVDDALSDESENPVQNKVITGKIGDLKAEINQLEDALNVKEGARYGVIGIGQKSAALSRLWDAAGMRAQVGTDGDNSSVVNDFDHALPFMRRKCVGYWSSENGNAVFHVNAYEGENGYAEDGTAGDYVAVECPKCYYYFDGNILGISAHKYEGWRAFDIFTHDHNPNQEIDYYYRPAYDLCLDNAGHAVCLPGYYNAQGSYKALMDAARTYKNGDLGTLPISYPMALSFYEWALFTIEFATQNCQSVMFGCGNLRSNSSDVVTFFGDTTHALVNNWRSDRVVGMYVAIVAANRDVHHANDLATHKVLSLTRVNSSGTPDSSGTYTLMELQDLGRNYYTYDTTGATEYHIGGRPYITGACNGVSTPSGSPVSNTNGYYPMKYRHAENIYGNQYKTTADLFNMRVGTGDDDYRLEYYYLLRPQDYAPSTSSKPDAADLATDKFVKLGVETAHENYVNGYIKSKKYDEDYPDIWIPFETVGGSASTYFADYAYLVSSSAVRSVRLFGSWSTGSYAGLAFFNGIYAPSASSAYYGGSLCFPQ